MEEVTLLRRKFTFLKGSNESIELDDFNPELGVEQIMSHYAQLYPEITNARTEDKGIQNGFHVIEFHSLAGTKG